MRSVYFFILGTIVAGTAGAGAWYIHARATSIKPADPEVAVPEKFLSIHQSILEAEHQGRVGVLFLGDSITDLWRDVPTIWHESFDEFSPCNAGVISDQIQHVRWRIENGNLDGIKPRVIVLLIGANNILLGNDSPETTANGVKDLIHQIQAKQPQARILLLGLFPNRYLLDAVAQTNGLLRTRMWARKSRRKTSRTAYIPTRMGIASGPRQCCRF